MSGSFSGGLRVRTLVMPASRRAARSSMRLIIRVPSSKKGTSKKLSTITSTSDSQPADMLIGQVQLAISADVVDQMWMLQVLLHCQSVVAHVRIFCIDSTKPSVAE